MNAIIEDLLTDILTYATLRQCSLEEAVAEWEIAMRILDFTNR